jgi:hypothetical protein
MGDLNNFKVTWKSRENSSLFDEYSSNFNKKFDRISNLKKISSIRFDSTNICRIRTIRKFDRSPSCLRLWWRDISLFADF